MAISAPETYGFQSLGTRPGCNMQKDYQHGSDKWPSCKSFVRSISREHNRYGG